MKGNNFNLVRLDFFSAEINYNLVNHEPLYATSQADATDSKGNTILIDTIK